MRFKITWRDGAYRVNRPEYGGGEVVDAEDYDRLLVAGDEMARVLGNSAGVGKRELAAWRALVASDGQEGSHGDG